MENIATYVLDGKRREDGSLYITSGDLPGFRLVVGPEENLEQEVTKAVNAFYPLFMASKARAEAERVLARITSDFAAHHKDVRLSVAFAMA